MSVTENPYELPLRGLREDNPRDFLAALGLLRIFDLLWPDLDAKLFWAGNPCAPVLSTLHPPCGDWNRVLVEKVQQFADHPTKPMAHGDIIKTSHSQYREAVENACHFKESEHPLAGLPLLLYACYSSQLGEDGGDVEPTGFSFANGQSGKKLLLDVVQLIHSIDAETLLQTLEGEAIPVAAKSLRWNPSEFRPAAYRSHDPGSKLKGDETKDHPALNVLAFFGLTFFPTSPTRFGGKTSGMHDERPNRYFQWPIWATPLCVDEIATLICASSTHLNTAYGIDRVWRSRRFSSDKSLYFAPAEIAR
ncbi:MAG: hypothetical protein KDN18_05635 [Verrucomicrobiae bacterium]|nr:hypothetical protein [Verrucomicrobiae bacterium]